MTELLTETALTFSVQIFIAGDIAQAKQVCREECMKAGLCVTVSPTSFIYTGGEESGVIVGFINYPRFPAKPKDIYARAKRLGHVLMKRLCQRSFSLMTPIRTVRYSLRAKEETA